MREIARNLNLPQMKVCRILKNNRYKPYHFHVSQTLHPGDDVRRIDYCNWLRQQVGDNDNFLNTVLWSDETRFTNCGLFNRNNEHIWAIENPHANRQIRNQVRFGLNVWAGLLGDRVIGPFIYDQTLNGQRYLEFLTTGFQEYLMDVPLNRLGGLWFQQDGAPPHNTRAVREFLNREFPGRWIGNRGVIEWPARSPDLSPLDFFLWGTIKNKVYRHPHNNVDELRASILGAFNSLRQRDIQRAINNINRRVTFCIQANGNIFEHLL